MIKFYFQKSVFKADIPGPIRYLLITLKPLRGPSVGVQPPTDAEKSDKVKFCLSQLVMINLLS
jgi:hypothetical protein